MVFGFGPNCWLLAATNAIYRCRLILQSKAKTVNIENFLLECNLGTNQRTNQTTVASIDKRRALHQPSAYLMIK